MRKRFLIPLLAALALPTACSNGPASDKTVNANIDPKVAKICMKAADFQGCVNAMTGKSSNNNLDNLRKAIKILPNRLSNTNLRDFTANTQQFKDALSLIDIDDLKTQEEKDFYFMSVRISNMVDALQNAWSRRINDGTYYGDYGYKSYYCSVLKPGVVKFNLAAGDNRVVYNGVVRGLFQIENCTPQEGQMINVITSDVNEIINNPSEAASKLFEPSEALLKVDTNPQPYRPVKKKKKKPIKEKEKPANINCNSPVWKKKPVCN